MRLPWIAASWLLWACGGSPAAAPQSPASAPQAPASPPPAPGAQAEPEPPCGAMPCRIFPTPKAAFQAVLDGEKPLALGIGEAHAQRGTEHIPSTTKRFTEKLLPTLQGRASDLIVELMMPNNSCKKTTDKVATQQKPVTKPQAESNQNEYVTLGHAARKRGIVPDVLRPSCEDLQQITEAGESDIEVMLATIARLTGAKVQALLAQNEKDGKPAMVVGYGGALHNDIAPSEAKASWSYGPALSQATGGRYVEIDLIVPEYIKDTDTWQALPWVPHYDRNKLGDKTVLFEVAPKSYVLVFPLTSAH